MRPQSVLGAPSAPSETASQPSGSAGWLHLRSVRVRLTLWYVAAMVVVLAVYAASVFTVVSTSVSQSLDDRLRGDFQWAAEMADQRPDGTLAWFEGGADDDTPWLQVWSPEGELLYRTVGAELHPLAESQHLAQRASNQIVAVPTDVVTYRVLSGHSKIGQQPVVLQVARSEAAIERELSELRLMLMLGLPLGVALAGLGGYSLARRALAPVDRMAERAHAITAEHLTHRLPVDNPNDELGRLATVFNETLGRLESSFDQMRKFTADVSHELRTPLTAIRSVGEVGLREWRDAREYRAIIGSMLEEVDRLSTLIDRLLTLSRAETGQAKLSLDVLDLGELAEHVVGHLGVLAEEKGQSITIERETSPHCVADRSVLRQALINIVDNAIKYTPPDGRIHLRVSDSPSGAILDVSDTGPGIAAEPGARIFDRFYRAGHDPTSEVKGAGLGLSIAKWAVEVNGGRLTLEKANGGGSRFRITLPSAPAARPPKGAGYGLATDSHADATVSWTNRSFSTAGGESTNG